MLCGKSTKENKYFFPSSYSFKEFSFMYLCQMQCIHFDGELTDFSLSVRSHGTLTYTL